MKPGKQPGSVVLESEPELMEALSASHRTNFSGQRCLEVKLMVMPVPLELGPDESGIILGGIRALIEAKHIGDSHKQLAMAMIQSFDSSN